MDRYLLLEIVPSCPVGLRILAFRPLNGKLKNISLSVLCDSAVKIADPFRVNIKPPVLRVVVDWYPHTPSEDFIGCERKE
ncbi:MAG: hypothetical protein JRI72_07985 [Deltaproteobacteria bacterium]|nr:hypothetical protein [Deltaproteobacteria bacterium]